MSVTSFRSLSRCLPLALLVGVGLLLCATGHAWAQDAAAAGGGGIGIPSINISVGNVNSAPELSKGLQVMILLTVLTLAPAILVMTTAFTRIVIVLSLVRQAIGLPSLPPNQVLIGFALILTFFVMAPTFDVINKQALQPYLSSKIPQQVALDRAIKPLNKFMLRQTHDSDLALFIKLAKIKAPKTREQVPTYILLPAFVISELKTAFQLGFIVFLPFLVIDMVVSSILVSMGMLFLPPVTISLPFKIVLFVLVDGWHLISEALVLGFR